VLGWFAAIGAPDRPYCAGRVGVAALCDLERRVAASVALASAAATSKGVQPRSAGRTGGETGSIPGASRGTPAGRTPIVWQVAGDVGRAYCLRCQFSRETLCRRWLFGLHPEAV